MSDKPKPTRIDRTVQAMGYRPGFWYPDTVSHDNRRRIGNVVTGVGLGGLAAASVPALQFMFPKTFNRFPEQRRRLMLAGGLAGLAAPWVATLPASMATQPDHVKYSAKILPSHLFSEALKLKERLDELEFGKHKKRTPVAKSIVRPDPNLKSSGLLSGTYPDTPLERADVARGLFSAVRRGEISEMDGARSAYNFYRMSDKGKSIPVGRIAAHAVAAGAGALAGVAAAKGLNYAFKLPPYSQAALAGTGAGIGTLLSIGKLKP